MVADAAKLITVNAALGHMGQEPVQDLGEAAQRQSLALVKTLRFADAAREGVLRRHGWTCALEYAVLQPSTIQGYTAPSAYPTVYQLPGDGLAVWAIEGQLMDCWGPRWQLGSQDTQAGGRRIIRSTSTGALEVAYIRRAQWGALDVHVRDAVALDLAARAAFAVTGKLDLVGSLVRRAEAAVLLAVSTDGTQEGGQPTLIYSQSDAIRGWAR